MIRRGRANTLIVAKLDRLSRSLRYVCTLVSDYFIDENHHLLSVCGLVNTHSAAGRMLLMNLANYNEFERAMISERTRETLQHLKAQGIRLGPAPYGHELSNQLDDKGRRKLVPLASEQQLIVRFAAAQADGVGFTELARQLNAEGIRARRGGEWTGRFISAVLQREGKHKVPPRKPYPPRVPLVYDKSAAAARARVLRAEGLSLRLVGVRLRKEGFVPLRGGLWHPASVAELLRHRDPGDRAGAAQRASELRAQGLSLREIGVRLTLDGYVPEHGGSWYPARVTALLAAAIIAP